MKNFKNELKDFNIDNVNYSKLRITRYAYNKVKGYASAACDVFKENIECYGYLINPIEQKDSIVTDAFLGIDQKVINTECNLDAESNTKSLNKISEMGYKTLGWWHSHGNMNPFHSDIDDKNFDYVYKFVFSNNKITLNEKGDLLISNPTKINYKEDESGNYIIISKGEYSDSIRINLRNKLKDEEFFLKENQMKDITCNKYNGLSIAYSLVVNKYLSKGYYAEVALRFSKDKDVTINKDAELYEMSSDKLYPNEDKIKKEVKERISLDDKLKNKFHFFK